MRFTRSVKLTLAIAFLTAATLAIPAAQADVIMDWNAKAEAIGVEKQLVNVPNARGLAMMHLAMFEAVNAIEQRYTPYKLKLAADRGLSKEAAAASAGYEVLVAMYPDQRQGLEGLLATSLAAIANSEAKTRAIELGKKAAADILLLRRNDGIDAVETYRPYTQAGVYVPTVVPAESTSGALTPWVMSTGSQFRPGPPPGLDSETWIRDVNEIREVGARNSTQRTPEQTTIARFWFQTGPRTYNPIVRQIALAKNMDVVDCARLYALTSMAGLDAFIAVFDAKYAYNLWRPITAIRIGDQTSNPRTPRDASWQPLGTTPMHPEYPCAHCIVAAAVATVLEKTVGNDVGEITLTSPITPGITRKWTRLNDYADEVSAARIYAGFHYRFSTQVANEMGKRIGELTAATQLRAPTR
jgi:hypothetical protein